MIPKRVIPRENEEKNVSRDFPKLKRNFQYDSNQI